MKDVEKSKNFYDLILGQKIIMDFGRNVDFEGDLAIWDLTQETRQLSGHAKNNNGNVVVLMRLEEWV